MKILRKIWARQRLFSTIFVCLLTVLVVSFSQSPFVVTHAEVIEDSWMTMADMPTGRLGPGVAAVNEKIYVIGGTHVDFLNTNEEYDPATDTWTTKTAMPTPRSGFATAVYQNKIYVIGGGVDFGVDEVTGINEVYDPSTDTWETKTSMPTPRQFFCANVVNGKIYLIGGSKPFNPNIPSVVPNINEVYDPSTDSWTTKTPPPTKVSSYASAVVDNKIYVISGSGESGNLTQIYDPETDSWSFGAQIPTPVWGAAAGATTSVLAPKRIYVLGGNPAFDLNQVYDPETDTWTMGAPMPHNRYGLGIAVVNDMLYAIGCSGSPDNKKNDRYTPFGYEQALAPITIRSDGSVDPDTAPIQRDGTVYTFSGNMYGSFFVERDNIVVDGAGYTLQGIGSGKGIDLSDRGNVTIRNVEIREVNYGIWLYNASNNTIIENTITGSNQWGIRLAGSSNNTVSGNTITDSDYGGIVAMDSDNNLISGNTITDNVVGLNFIDSENNIVSGNLIAKNDDDGIACWLENMSNTIIENTITNNGDVGILLFGAGYSNIIGNNIANNRLGISVFLCYTNVFYHNNFVNNAFHTEIDLSNCIWDKGEEGNYWDVYTGVDSNDDGIGDIPYVIDENNRDNYPLMNQWIPPTQQSDSFPTTWVVAAIVIIAVVASSLLVYFVKVKKTTGKAEE